MAVVFLLGNARSAVCADLTHPGPDHLQRSVRLFYDNKNERRVGKEQWMAEIKAAITAWKRNPEHRFAVCHSLLTIRTMGPLFLLSIAADTGRLG